MQSKLITQGRRGSHYNLDLINLSTGQKSTERVNSGAFIDKISLIPSYLTFLYTVGNELVAMDKESNEVSISTSLLNSSSKALDFLPPGANIVALLNEDVVVSVILPETATFTVKETLATSGGGDGGKGTIYKNAVLDNGFSLSVPEHVNQGDQVVVDLQKRAYISRVKK